VRRYNPATLIDRRVDHDQDHSEDRNGFYPHLGGERPAYRWYEVEVACF
jgi:hypothetical protein